MMQELLRLDKLLGHSGFGSRKEIKLLCKGGSVTIDGQVCRDSACKINPANNVVMVDGKLVRYARYHYLMLYKPSGVVSATEDHLDRTVLDLLPQEYKGAGLFPVGRLDKDTTGLLLLTNDGTWAHRITSPKKHINKLYEAVVDGAIPDTLEQQFAQGIILADGLHCLPAKAEQIGEHCVRIIVQEGKFHQVKRMCAAVGLTVTQLHRAQIGALLLDTALAPGEARSLTEAEKDLVFA